MGIGQATFEALEGLPRVLRADEEGMNPD